MAISFSCHQCGRNLKAPDNAAGKSSKCPGCGATVTCPERSTTPSCSRHRGRRKDMASPIPTWTGPTRMAEAPVGTAAAPEARKPCPMCGEMIIATAAKCRFCGEVFDATLKKSGLGGREVKSMASAQRNLMISILLWIVCAAVSSGLRTSAAVNRDPGMNLVVLIVSVIGLAGYIGVACYIFLLEKKMNGVGSGIMMGLLAILPCINVVLAFMLNQRVNRYFQERGYEVGLFGAKVS